MLVESGAPVAQAQRGHSDPSVTLGSYSHLVGDSQRQAVEKLAGILDYSGRQMKVKTQLISIGWMDRVMGIEQIRMNQTKALLPVP